MENIKILSLKRQIHEISTQHNKLTLLCKMLYSNIKTLNQELVNIKSGLNIKKSSSQSQMREPQVQQQMNTTMNTTMNTGINGSLNDLQADEILKQLSQS